jgi:hypothetical protein
MTDGTNLAWPERVDLKDIWEDEPGQFTPWLAKPENLRQLGATLGLELEDSDTEVSVGGYSADIVATIAGDERRVVIENQLAKTDHRHLGQILTYAAGLDAPMVVWIAKQFTDEHRAALEWLNSHTNADIAFFGVQIEVWRIGDSPCAPKFNIVAKPNEWTKPLPPDTQLTATRQAQSDFWSGFVKYAAEHANKITPTAVKPRSWMRMSTGKTGFGLVAFASTSRWDGSVGPEVRAAFMIRDSKQTFEELSQDRAAIEGEFGEELEWYSEEGVQKNWILILQSVDWRKPGTRAGCYHWLVERLDRLHAVFQPRIQQLP